MMTHLLALAVALLLLLKAVVALLQDIVWLLLTLQAATAAGAGVGSGFRLVVHSVPQSEAWVWQCMTHLQCFIRHCKRRQSWQFY
jgi:hypothetical protein